MSEDEKGENKMGEKFLVYSTFSCEWPAAPYFPYDATLDLRAVCPMFYVSHHVVCHLFLRHIQGARSRLLHIVTFKVNNTISSHSDQSY